MPFGSSFPKSGSVEIEVLGDIIPEKISVEEIVEKSRNLIVEWKKKK